MSKIIKISDAFLINNKNKIMLASVAFMLVCCIGYFAVSDDKVSSKGLIIFLMSAVFLGMFYGIKLLLTVRNRIMPMNIFAGYIFDLVCVLFALFVTFTFLYDFILNFDGYNLIIFSVAAGFLNAVVFARIKNLYAEKNKIKNNKGKTKL